MLRTNCYRFYPSRPQKRRLERTLETCRRFHNDCLAERKEAYRTEGRTVSKVEQLRRVKTLKASNPSAANIHSHVLQVAVADLDQAFQGFFRRVKAGEKPGFPRFKGVGRFHSIGLKEYGNGFKLNGRRLKVYGIGRLAVRWHRPLAGTIKTLRLVHKADGWYACFVCEVEPHPLPATGQAVGVDVGVCSLLTTSDGDHVANPRWYRTAQTNLRVAQRRVSRRKKGGTNRRKAVNVLARRHQQIQNRRKDFLNKVAHGLIARYDYIALEDLRIPNMVKNPYLAKSILDAGWGYFVAHLTHKAEEAGRVVAFVDPAYTSKTCSRCDTVVATLTLKDRWIDCPCGLSKDREENAAINILRRSRVGHTRWASSLPGGGLAQEAVES